MVIEISRREVLNNIVKFKDTLLEKRGAMAHVSPEMHQRSYSALMNRHTGDIRFSQRINALEQHLPTVGKREGVYEDWQNISITVTVEEGQGMIHFGLHDSDGARLNPSACDALAWRIAMETIETMNVLAEEFRATAASQGTLSESSVLQDLSPIQLSFHGLAIKELSGWSGALGRLGAEAALLGKEEGVYLMRESGPIAKSAAFWLGEANGLPMDVYILDVMREEGRMAEHLLAQTQRGWLLVSDESDLNHPSYRYYPTIRLLFHALRNYAKEPLI